MLNVRIDSLPPDRETSNKDCRQCNKRRIKCDRTIPKCRKCTIRGFQCPGYQPVQLKWDHGVASRKPSADSSSIVKVRSCSRAKDAPSSLEPTSQFVLYPDSDWLSPPAVIEEASPRLLHLSPPSPVADRSLIDGFLSRTISADLFRHFNINVAPRLTWVDTPDHPWRKLMYPLAKRCECLRLSILSVAAAHLSSTTPASQPNSAEIQTMTNRLRESSLRTLNSMLRAELERFNSPDRPDHGTSSLVEILATTLVLCYGEMLIPNSTNWNLHLHACRVLIERHQWRIWQTRTPDPAATFLMREVSDIEVFRTFGAFNRDAKSSTILPPRTILDSHFGAFTGLLWEITMEERRRHHLAEEGQPLPPVDMAGWRARMDHAYTKASTDTAWLSKAHGGDIQKWMNAIVSAVYHSSLIYSYQALASPDEPQIHETIQTSISQVTSEIDFVTAGPIHILSHDIFLPLFILGTETYADEEKQATIEHLFQKLMSTTGLWCNHTALHFLKAFWESKNASYHDVGKWIQFAREHEQDIGPFLIF